MAYYVYQSAQFEEDAAQYGVSREVIERQIVGWVENQQSIGCFNRFPMPFLTKKKFAGYSNRVIAAEELVELDGEEHNVIVLLRLVLRSNRIYDQYAKDPEATATPWLQEVRPLLLDWLKGRIRQRPARSHPRPDDGEYRFLFDPSAPSSDDDTLVCESHDWIEDVRAKGVSNRLVNLCGIIAEIVDGSRTRTEAFEDEFRKNELSVRYRAYPSMRKVLLLRVFHQAATSADPAAIEQEPKEVLRRCSRAYGSLLLADEDRWIEIERADEGTPNLALSPEEARVLRSSRELESNGGYPMFINGRAGSGKSTVLQYLFSDTIRNWRRNCATDDLRRTCPIYLATNAELLGKAKRNVLSLLRHNAEAMITSESVHDKEWLKELSESSFFTVSSILRSQLPTELRSRFRDENRISYGRFRELWMEKFGKQPKMVKQCGPQVSWHVIRSFIKGLQVDGYLEEVDDYLESPKGEQNVSITVFKTVFERVWQDWYRELTSTGEVWDDQDLARAVLDSLETADPQVVPVHDHVAVFCDEAQDLTRPEIECLYRLSAFSRRTLDRDSARRVPFVFAGDPFQTLNPTGFRWEAMKSSFNERLTANLSRYARSADAVRINYQELSHNYRSTRPVVHFCNSLQCARTLTTESEVRPQESWAITNDAPQPMYFFESDAAFAQALRQQQNLTIIVPCEEGDEAEFVRKSPFLSSIVTWDDDNTVPKDVLSAIRAKGLEFNRILLFGFGMQPEAQQLCRLLSENDEQPSREELLQVEYFLNKLYVGASRAMKRLFIVDSTTMVSQGGLWGFFADNPQLESLIKKLPASAQQVWREATTTMVPGGIDALGQDRDDPAALAEGYERAGFAERSAYHMRQAAESWRRAKQETRAAAAAAQAAEWDHQFDRAGELFVTAGKPERAVQAYFTGGHYDRISHVAAPQPALANRVDARLAGILSAATFNLRDFALLLDECAQLAAQESITKSLPGRIESYSHAFAKALARMEPLLESAKQSRIESARSIVRNLKSSLDLGLPREALRDPLAKVALASQDYETVLSLYDSDTSTPIARKAYAELVLGGKRDAVGPNDARNVAQLLRDRKDYVRAAQWYLNCKDTALAWACISDALQSETEIYTADLQTEFVRLIEQLQRDMAWRELLNLFERHSLHGGARGRLGEQVREMVDALCVIERHFIPFVATQSPASLDPIAGDLVRFLKQHLGESLPRWERWRSRVRIEHVANAFEKANNLVAALQFYELLLTDPRATPLELRFGRQRWLRCKQRQISVEIARAQSGGRARTSHVTKLEGDMMRFCLRHSIEASEAGVEFLDTSLVPIFPSAIADTGSATPISGSAQLTPTSIVDASPTEPTPGTAEFDVKYFESRGRVRIESSEGDSIVINVATKSLETQDYVVESAGEGEWIIDSIDATVCVSEDGVSVTIGAKSWSFKR